MGGPDPAKGRGGQVWSVMQPIVYISPTGPGRTLRRWAGCSGCRPCCTAGGTQGTGIGRLPRAFCSKSRRSGVCAHTHRHARERPRLLGENRLKAAEGEGSARTWYPHGHGRKERSSSSIPSRHSGHASIGSSGSAMVGGARALRSVGPEYISLTRKDALARQQHHGEREAERVRKERRGQGRSRNATASRSYDRVPTEVLAVQLCSLLFLCSSSYAVLSSAHARTFLHSSLYSAVLFACFSYAFRILFVCFSFAFPILRICFLCAPLMCLHCVRLCPLANIVRALLSILVLCFPYAPPMLLLCSSHALPMLHLYLSYALPMLLLYLSYAPPILLLCSSYAFPMLFLCFSYAPPMVFLCTSAYARSSL